MSQNSRTRHVRAAGDIILWSTESGHMRSRLILPGILAMKGDQRPIESVALLDCGVHNIVTAGRQVLLCARMYVYACIYMYVCMYVYAAAFHEVVLQLSDENRLVVGREAYCAQAHKCVHACTSILSMYVCAQIARLTDGHRRR